MEIPKSAETLAKEQAKAAMDELAQKKKSGQPVTLEDIDAKLDVIIQLLSK